jgi:Tol biopolymer transport system component/DNA-binding winged helix-turn-helix (wHTH) protein
MAVSSGKSYEFGEWRLDPAEHLLSRSGSRVSLGPKVFDTLLVLVENAGRLVTKDEFMKSVWPDTVVEDLALTQNISQLRKILGDGDEPVIETVPKRGYRLLVSVTVKERTQSVDAGAQDKLAVHASRIPLSRVVYYLGLAAVVGALVVAALIVANRNRGSLHASNFVQITNDGQAKQGPIVSDGLRLYFREGASNHYILAQAAVTGGEATALPAPLQAPYILDMAPNRSELFVGSSGPETSTSVTPRDSGSMPPLWIFSLPGGALRRAGQNAADAATWSADGSEIAFVDGAVVYRARTDGSDAKEVARLPGTGSLLRWSRDGSRLGLTVFDKTTGLSSLWEVLLSGKGAQRLLGAWNERGSECCGNWTADGKFFVFQASREGKTDIWALAENSQQPVQLTAGQMNSLAPLVSANGKKLYVIGEQLKGELSRYDSKAGEFVPYLSGISAEFLDFSKDGQWVTYVSFPQQSLWRSRIDGSERLQLTSNPVRAVFPQWSPDGKRIAFFDVAPGKPWRICLISSDGGVPEPLLNESRNEMDPTWSPDGTAVAFSYFPSFDRRTRDKLGIFIVNLKTRSAQQVPGSDGLWAPRWSPDGRYLVTRSTDMLTLMLYDFKSQTWSRILENTYVGNVNWSSDGGYLYYSRRGSDPAIVRIRLVDGAIEQVADLKGVRQAGFRNGFWMGLTPDNSPLVLRDIGTEEIYSLDLSTH